jgi:hypothetical protein
MIKTLIGTVGAVIATSYPRDLLATITEANSDGDPPAIE